MVKNYPDGNEGELDINLWLVKEGWAFPTFYASMTDDEIETLATFADEARARKAGIWKYYSADIGSFDFQLIFRGKNADLDPEGDKGM
jgi:endonuclease YncB( thermonuclease family)